MDDFLIRALAAGLIAALMAGPLGCFVVWRRMAYFGDTLAHASLLGIALSLWVSIDVTFGLLAGVGGCAVALSLLQRTGRLADDTLLGLIAHGALATGLIAIALLPNTRVDLMAYLFGDILAVTWRDLYLMAGGAVLVLGTTGLLWRRILLVTVDPDLAKAAGIDPGRARLWVTVLVAVVIALSIKIIGVLLITALLIIPPAAARPVSRSPEHMAVVASLIGMVAVAGGIAGSARFDTPTGPSIVVAAVLLFVGVSGIALWQRRA